MFIYYKHPAQLTAATPNATCSREGGEWGHLHTIGLRSSRRHGTLPTVGLTFRTSAAAQALITCSTQSAWKGRYS